MKTLMSFILHRRAGMLSVALAASLLATANARAGHNLIAHYSFDGGVNAEGADSSTNGNSIFCGTSWGPATAASTNAVVGQAAQFFGTSAILPCNPSSTFTAWTNTFAGSFSVSVWINTTNTVGADGDELRGYSGQSAVYVDNNADGSIPVGLTGTKAAFFTGGATPTTLHSATSITTGTYALVTVTRDAVTGQKALYINGVLDAVGSGSTGPLGPDISYASIGGEESSSYTGLLDDLQIYSGVLNSAEVLYIYQHPGVSAPNLPTPGGGLVAHYPFDNSAHLGADSSGSGNDMDYLSSFNGGSVAFNTNAIAGAGAAMFNSNEGNGGGLMTWNPMPTNILNALAGDFTISAWVKTVQTFGESEDNAYNGAGIVSADVPGTANDSVPLALTGGYVAINTGDANQAQDSTLNSDNFVADGMYHHVVTTRSQSTGEMDIYIDGVLDDNSPIFGSTNLLNAPVLVTIGALADASNPNPSPNSNPYYNGYEGLLDDLQIYSRVLTPTQISQLHNNPGTALSFDTVTAAVPVAHYTFDNTNDGFFSIFHDDSGNGNNIVTVSYFGGGVPESTPDGISGAGIIFNGSNWFTLPTNLLSTIAGDFSASVWIKTTQVAGGDSDQAFSDAGILSAYAGGVNHSIPMAITGHKLGFLTGNPDSTLHSTNNVDGGTYVHVVVTRQEDSGTRKIYINGALDSTDTANTAPLTNSTQLFFAMNDWSYQGFRGTADDLQIYSGVLTPVQVAYLYTHPGLTAPINPGNSVTLLNPSVAGSSFKFSFITLAGLTHTIEYNTNLTAGIGWRTNSTVMGNGTTTNISIPLTISGTKQAYFRVASH
jgi:hypothetical protein